MGKNRPVCHFVRNTTRKGSTQNQKGHEAQVDLNTPQNTNPGNDHGAPVKVLNTSQAGNDHGATPQKDTNIKIRSRGRDPKVLKSIWIRKHTTARIRKAHVKPRKKF